MESVMPQHHRSNANRRQNKNEVDIENHDWKEDPITIFQKPRLEKSQDYNQKD